MELFTIQNVPIKSELKHLEQISKMYLQYKMFLLNKEKIEWIIMLVYIYNTKCSY